MRHLNSLLVVAMAASLYFAANDANGQILSSKRGFADVGANYTNLQATGAGWYYTWGTGVGNPGNFDAQHFPMIWGGTPSQNTLNNIRNRPNVEWLLGFNEPERTDQANMSVSQAISSWSTIANGLSGSGIKLVSPAVSDTGAGQAWLADFMNQASNNGLPVDAVAFHWYGVSNPNDPVGAANSFLSRVDSYHNAYNKPVFITEFAIHDWGGNYSDAAITEANRQFLDIVVPALEARDHVAGYSWYHWFSDARLYSGSPALPTEMGHRYVGALTDGQLEDIGNQNYGEHVAFLAGGEITRGAGSAGSLKYINALSEVSTISGVANWDIGSGNWVRVQPEAHLRKTGSNELAIVGGSITNNGVVEVAQGMMRATNTISGTGEMRVTGGTLALTGFANMPQISKVDIRSGGALDVSGLLDSYVLFNGQNLEMSAGANVVGNVIANSGSQVSSAGTFANDFRARGGSAVMVGDVGLTRPTRFLIDDFENYGLGDVRDVASPPWTSHQNTSFADIENDSGNQVLTYGWAGNLRGTSRELSEETTIGNSDTATLFFRVNSKTDDPDHSIGITDQASTDAVVFGDFEAQVRIKSGTPGTFSVDARDGGAFTATLASGRPLNTWHNFWLVIDQATDTYDVYMNVGLGEADGGDKLNSTPLDFRNGTADMLDTILALAGGAPIDNALRVDDLFLFEGADLTNPISGFDAGLTLAAAELHVAGDFTHERGASLYLDIHSPAVHDTVRVDGELITGGILDVTLESGAPSPQAGDVFSLLIFDSASGGFLDYSLPELASGLAWNVSNLLTTGELEVVVDVDLDDDGFVTGNDYLLIQQTDPSLTSAWQALYGSELVIGMGSGPIASIVPEPSSLILAFLALAMVSSRSHDRIAN